MAAPRTDAARRLLDEVCGPLGVRAPRLRESDVPEAVEWARSGAMALTGRADGPPLLVPGTPASTVRAALDLIKTRTGADLPGVGLLAERAAILGSSRRAPSSAGGAFRAVPSADGWFGLSLARPSDVEAVPALVEADDAAADPWPAVAAWLSSRTSAVADERAALLGLAAAPIPAHPPLNRRPGVVATVGGRRTIHDGPPLVVDFSALWAGPLCAHLLGLGGARVIKVESSARPDGARYGPPQFYDLMHGGHESVALDFATDRATLNALVRQADVVIEASRPRALRQLGIEAAEHVDAGTIWVSITAYGRTGDDAMRIGFGDDIAAGAGLIAWDDGLPCPAGDAIADPITGVVAAAAACLALRGKHGCLLDLSMHDVTAAAAQPVDASGARVIGRRGGWAVEAGPIVEPVAAPRARRPAGRAAELGRDTARASSAHRSPR